MERCSVQIITETDGRKSQFEAEGTISRREKNVLVRYSEEGDPVTLRAEAHSFMMERKPRLYMRFVPDRETTARLVYERNGGEIPVFTTFYSYYFSDSEQKITIELNYELRFQNFLQNFSVKIFIQIISEDS